MKGIIAAASLSILLVGCATKKANIISQKALVDDLASSIKRGSIEPLKSALASDPKGELENCGQINLLTVAVQANNNEAINLLLLHGANPNGSRYSRETPLTLAVKNQDAKLVDKLLFFGADPNIATPLWHIRNTPSSIEIARKLVDAGADPNGRMPYDSYLLAHAAQYKGEWCVRLLLDLGADPNGPSDAVNSPMDYARAAHKPEIVKLLVSRGGRPKRRHERERLAPNRGRDGGMRALQEWEGSHGR